MSEPVIFRSKISYGLLTFTLLLCVATWAVPALDGASLQSMLILSLVIVATIAFILHAFLSTRYWINDNQELRLKAGFINDLTIPIESITKVHKTSSFLASPAASFDRIEVFYGKWNSVIISPKEKQQFIFALKKINPDIETKL